MINTKYLITVLIFLGLYAVDGYGQASLVLKDNLSIPERIQRDYDFNFSTSFDFKYSGRISFLDATGGLGSVPRLNHLPGMFCKLEYKLETRSKLAPRVRLGSLQYANWMEGKLPAWSTSGY